MSEIDIIYIVIDAIIALMSFRIMFKVFLKTKKEGDEC